MSSQRLQRMAGHSARLLTCGYAMLAQVDCCAHDGVNMDKELPPDLQAWVEARKRHRLSHAHVAMARELGFNPKKLGKIDHQEPWKAPLQTFIEQLYRKRFGKDRPDVVMSIEERAAAIKAKKLAQKARRSA
jgi:hypothetical protein